jgi:polyhydroxybutyrate depolymerase
MSLRKYWIVALVAIMAMVLSVGSPVVIAQESSPEFSPGLHTGWMMKSYESGTYNRTYLYYVPTGYDGSEAVSLLFSFHGLGSNGDDQRDLTRFDELAEQEGFIAVFPYATVLDPDDYPEAQLPPLPGAEIQWNLGAGSLQYYAGIDDVGFVMDMVDWFETSYNIDASRVYSTGMSDGALFSYLLAFNLTGTFAAIAPVCAPMPWGFGNITAAPITVIEVHGTADPILSYYGYGGSGGNVTYSVDQTIAYWRGIDNVTGEPMETVWGPTNRDSTVVHRYIYSGGTDGTEVILFKVEAGGHTWPGGVLYSAYVGAVTTHIDGSALIWRHLPPEKYYLEVSSTLGGDVTTPGQDTFANVESTGAYMFFGADTGDAVVNLKAVPKSDSWEFVNWTGDVTTVADVDAATTTITITPDRDYEITANFQVKSEEPEPEPEPEPTPSGGMCFIATAAYGTSTAKQLDLLRKFRDDPLLESAIGSRLVDLYYQVSPPVAEFIAEHSFVRTLVRELMIDPIVWAVEAIGDMWRN